MRRVLLHEMELTFTKKTKTKLSKTGLESQIQLIRDDELENLNVNLPSLCLTTSYNMGRQTRAGGSL